MKDHRTRIERLEARTSLIGGAEAEAIFAAAAAQLDAEAAEKSALARNIQLVVADGEEKH